MRGLPDGSTVPTIVQRIVKSVTVSAPAGTVGNWSAHIFTGNELFGFATGPVRSSQGVAQSRVWDGAVFRSIPTGLAAYQQSMAAPPTATFGATNIWTWNVDTQTMFPNGTVWVPPTASTFITTYPPSGSVPLNTVHGAADMRAVAYGLEIENTTAELYKQGTTTVSRVPNVQRTTMAPIIDTTLGGYVFSALGTTNIFGFPGLMPAVVTQGPPATIAEALDYANSRQWEARRGAYCVGVFNALENPLTAGTFQLRMLVNSDAQAPAANAFDNIAHGYATYAYGIDTNNIVNVNSLPWSQQTPMETTSIMLTGLSLQTTFTVRSVTFVEVAPHLNDPLLGDLVYSTQMSPAQDQQALLFYQKMARSLPAGVPFDMNPFGEFWKSVCDKAKAIVPTISRLLKAVPLPLAQVGSSFLDAIVPSARKGGRVRADPSAMALTAASKKRAGSAASSVRSVRTLRALANSKAAAANKAAKKKRVKV